MDYFQEILILADDERIRKETEMNMLKEEKLELLNRIMQLEKDVKESQKIAWEGLFNLLPYIQRPLITEYDQLCFGNKESRNVVIENQPKKASFFPFKNLLKKSDGNAKKGAEGKAQPQLYPSLNMVITEQPTMKRKVEANQVGKENGSEPNGEFSFKEAGRRICNGALECFVLAFICLIGD